jgi:hypothetical protein
MNKPELSKLLEEKVQEKIKEGFTIPTYALDAASRDRVKRALHPQSHSVPHENHSTEEWEEYIKQVEAGTYAPTHRAQETREAPQPSTNSKPSDHPCGSTGLWKARRH